MVDLDSNALVTEFESLDRELGVVRRLSQAVATNPIIKRGRNTILIFHFSGHERLEIRSYGSILPAQEAYAELEEQLVGKADIVLVNAQHAEDLRRAFQNYFTDVQDFVNLVTEAHKELLSS